MILPSGIYTLLFPSPPHWVHGFVSPPSGSPLPLYRVKSPPCHICPWVSPPLGGNCGVRLPSTPLPAIRPVIPSGSHIRLSGSPAETLNPNLHSSPLLWRFSLFARTLLASPSITSEDDALERSEDQQHHPSTPPQVRSFLSSRVIPQALSLTVLKHHNWFRTLFLSFPAL